MNEWSVNREKSYSWRNKEGKFVFLLNESTEKKIHIKKVSNSVIEFLAHSYFKSMFLQTENKCPFNEWEYKKFDFIF